MLREIIRQPCEDVEELIRQTRDVHRWLGWIRRSPIEDADGHEAVERFRHYGKRCIEVVRDPVSANRAQRIGGEIMNDRCCRAVGWRPTTSLPDVHLASIILPAPCNANVCARGVTAHTLEQV